MENLSVNLDDGELWIPSDILPTDELHYHGSRGGRDNRSIPVGGGSLDDLSRQSSKVKVNQHDLVFTQLGSAGTMAQTPTPTPNGRSELKVGPKGVDPGPSELKVGPKGVAPGSTSAPSSNGRSEPKVGPTRVDRGRFFNNKPGPVHNALCLPALPFPVNQPVYPMVGEQLMETRKGRSPIHSNGQRGGRCRYHHKHNGVFPTQPSSHGFGFGPMSSTSSGTGVFIPRTNSLSCEGSQNNPGVTLQNIPPRKLGTRKVEDQPIPSPDVGLPMDWTY